MYQNEVLFLVNKLCKPRKNSKKVGGFPFCYFEAKKSICTIEKIH